jgi:hypothetical protein
MRGLQRLDGAVEIEIRFTDGREEFGRQRQIEFEAGCPVAALARSSDKWMARIRATGEQPDSIPRRDMSSRSEACSRRLH